MHSLVLILPIFIMQKRTREKLVNVLSLCGQEVGLTKNPSVSFILFPVYVSLVVLPVCKKYTHTKKQKPLFSQCVNSPVDFASGDLLVVR